MSESKHDGLDVGAIQKAFERLYLVDWDSAAEKGDRSETYSARMRPFEGTARMPLYPIPRFLEEKKKDVFDGMAAIDKSRAAIIENERWGLLRKKMVSMIADAGTDDSAVMQAIENERCRALTAPNRVPNHNNQLLLLL